ncbi:hypothetical protein ACWIG4_18160 [Streptomyces sp. NPDC002248]
MIVLLLLAALVLAAGYGLGRWRPAHRLDDWAVWQRFGPLTGWRRRAVWVVSSVGNLTWIAAHPRRSVHAWRHRNDPPPPRAPAPTIRDLTNRQEHRP